MKYQFVTFISVLILMSACSKFLDKKSDAGLSTISTVKDMQALLDNETNMTGRKPGPCIISADDFFIDEAWLQQLDETYVNLYTWAEGGHFRPDGGNDWAYLYQCIFIANSVLEASDNISVSGQNQIAWNDVVGQAYFWRGYCFQFAVNIWSLAYDPVTSTADLGIPLRLNTNYFEISTRSTVEESYQQIIADLKKAASLLPVTPLHPVRPSRPAAFAALSRCYLYMGDFEKAELYADSAIALKSDLMDFNNSAFVIPTAQFRITRFNPEVVFDCILRSTVAPEIGWVDSTLYRSYEDTDMRKAIFFDASTGPLNASFRGDYGGGVFSFGGIKVPELYLNRAESRIRNGKISQGLQDINQLLAKRYSTGTYTPFISNNQDEALQFVLSERRKELVGGAQRWMDIKRLNRLGANIVLKRRLGNQELILPPGDHRYALSIPENVIALTGMPQNPR